MSGATVGRRVDRHLERLREPSDLHGLAPAELAGLAAEMRRFLVDSVARTGGHLGSNLGIVELTLAVHRVFRSPDDVVVWDTGHCAYPHKLVTGRAAGFRNLRQAGGLSGYPCRAESSHDWVENSHASTCLGYADGLAQAFARTGARRRVVAVLGDGALTGGLAYEGLNNIGFHRRDVVVVLNDNGRSYAPTISNLVAPEGPDAPGRSASTGRARAFFEALGFSYVGPVDGHEVAQLEIGLRAAAAADGPVVVHALTEKGRGYAPASGDDEKRLHDCPAFTDIEGGPGTRGPSGYTGVFAEELVCLARQEPRLVAVTAAMPGSTGLLPFREAFPDRFVDVGIAEQHAVAAAAGMAMGGLRPVVAVYSTFLTRALDQLNMDVALHGLPVVLVADRAGITGDDGPSHNGVLDMAFGLRVPGLTVFAPSSAPELRAMLGQALRLDGPSLLRFPKGSARDHPGEPVGTGLGARCVRRGGGAVCLLAVGTMLGPVEDAARSLGGLGIEVTVWDVRVAKPLDERMVDDAAGHDLVATVEDGVVSGGVGEAVAAAVGGRAPGRRRLPVTTLGTPLRFLDHGNPSVIHRALGLDGEGIARAVLSAAGTAGVIDADLGEAPWS